jgi:hypothetical protein
MCNLELVLVTKNIATINYMYHAHDDCEVSCAFGVNHVEGDCYIDNWTIFLPELEELPLVDDETALEVSGNEPEALVKK